MWFVSQMMFGLVAAAGATTPTASPTASPTANPTTFELISDHPPAVSKVEIQCPDGYRRQQTARTRFAFDDVPEGVCTAVVVGATTARFRPVLAGEQYRCRADAESLFCNADREEERAEPADVVSDGPPANSGASSSTVQVTITDPSIAGWGLLTCADGMRIKATFVGSRAVFKGVPAEECSLSLKGASPVKYHGVWPGDRVSCARFGTRTRCVDQQTSTAKSVKAPSPGSVRVEAEPQVPVAPDHLKVSLEGPTPSTWAIVVCPSGYRARARFKAGTALFTGLPEEACNISFKGGPPAIFQDVKGGQQWTCALSSGLADCR